MAGVQTLGGGGGGSREVCNDKGKTTPGMNLTVTNETRPRKGRREVIYILKDIGQRRAHDVEIRKGQTSVDGKHLEDRTVGEDDQRPHDGPPESAVLVVLLADVERRAEVGVARLATAAGRLPPQDCHLVGLPEAGEEQDFGDAGEDDRHPEHLTPTQRLGDGPGDGGSGGAPDQGRQHDGGHGAASLVRDKHVAHDGRVEHVGGHGHPRQAPGGDEERGAPAQGGQGRGRDEEDVGRVDDRVPPEELGEGCDQERAARLAQFPDGDQKDAGGFARVTAG